MLTLTRWLFGVVQASAAPWKSELERSTSGRRKSNADPRPVATPKKIIDA